MLAIALHIDPTAERQAPWQPTPGEAIEAVLVMERYARGGARDRLSAAEDMHRIITRVAMRACEEMTCKS
jgi:hypothetical protein